MTVLEIKDNMCWRCAERHANTTHHGLPQQLKPKNNVLVPVCEKCHGEINKCDLGSLSSHMYKVLKILEDKRKAIFGMQRILSEIKKEKEKK